MRAFMMAIIFMAVAIPGCARVRVEAPKEPIKVDITMRLDVYQHVVKDIDDIESIVSGTTPRAAGITRKASWLIENVYAEDGLSPDVEAAALRRKDRLPQLTSWEEKGVIGENREGLVVVRASGSVDAQLVSDENADRMVIYQWIAKKNGTSVASVKELYAKKLQETAPSGTPIEVMDGATGNYGWKIR
ncbi:MAG: DUF1318 domain-containing protein [Candidatus Omnitrophota bacterium]|nr:YdbL family protein [Candidatus Omnitrophota bacterium]